MKIFVVGGGAFPTAMAELCARLGLGYEVSQWYSTHDYLHLEMLLKLQRLERKENYLYLPRVELHKNIDFTDKFDATRTADIIFLGQPSKFSWQPFLEIAKFLPENSKSIVVLLSKGFASGETIPLGVKTANHLKSELGFYNFAVLSGPTFAKDILVPNKARFVSLASRNLQTIQRLKRAFVNSDLYFVGTTDVTGVSMGGALKNAYAIGYGVLAGVGAVADFLEKYIWERALPEMKVFLDLAGAHPKTLHSPAVAADFAVTCHGDSRNKKFGEFLAKFQKKEDIDLRFQRITVEGYDAMKTLYHISATNRLFTPILYKIHDICELGANPSTILDLF